MVLDCNHLQTGAVLGHSNNSYLKEHRVVRCVNVTCVSAACWPRPFRTTVNSRARAAAAVTSSATNRTWAIRWNRVSLWRRSWIKVLCRSPAASSPPQQQQQPSASMPLDSHSQISHRLPSSGSIYQRRVAHVEKPLVGSLDSTVSLSARTQPPTSSFGG